MLDIKKQSTFLIADGNPDSLDAQSALLQSLGYYNYLQAEEGAEAWAMFRNFDVDMVICSNEMPDINALDLLKLIRSNEEYDATPFIMVAENVTTKLVFRAGRAGVSDIIVWPFSEETFKKKIKDIIELEQEPNFIEAEKEIKRGTELMKAGRDDEALKVFEGILSVHETAEVYFNMGYIKSARGQFEDALKCFHRATRINNDFARAYKKMGEVYSKMGKTEEAEKYYNRAAEIYMERKDDDEAENMYEAVVKLKPDTINVYNSLGILYRRQSRYDEALEQYRKALKVHPNDENIHFNMARLFLDLHRIDEATQSLTRALKINPGFTEARELLRMAEMGVNLTSKVESS